MRSSYVRKRRSKLEVCLDILAAINEGETKPTRIMSATNMSWRQLHQEFEQLLGSELIMVTDATSKQVGRKDDKRSKFRYHLTPKGTNVLRYLKKKASGLEELMEVMHAGTVR